jgi:hypothetical protein
MSSVSSYDGSEKELFHQRTLDGFMPRHSYLRKSDFMDSFDSTRSPSRDTDAWSVAATVDDQESVISTNTQKSRLVHDTDDDNLTVEGITPTVSTNNISLDLNVNSLDIASLEIDTLASQADDDKYARSLTSRSVAAEYGDQTTDGFGSELSLTHDDDDDDVDEEGNNDIDYSTEGHTDRNDEDDFRNDRHSDDHHEDDDIHLYDDGHGRIQQQPHHHHHRRHHRHHLSHSPVAVDDAIRAPTEPQPSIATVDKSYTHLIEENEILQAQLRHLETTTKQQQDIIASMQSHHYHHQPYNDLLVGELNSSILSQQLTTWAGLVTSFARQWTTTPAQQRQVEQDLFHHVMEYYLHSLPFGTENQVLLNTAYQDQLVRFHNTLGSNFAKWYRRQTVQSLARNPATQDYLHVVRVLITQHICRVLDADPSILTESTEWQTLLDHCARLSLELHSSEQDVLIRPVAPGTIYDSRIMTVVDGVDSSADAETDKTEHPIKSMVCPLFIDEEDTVLLPARVTLE